MIRSLLAVLVAAAAPAAAQDISTRLATDGLSPTEAYLAGLADPDPTQRFALGAVRFLGGIEKTLQTRWMLGINAERTELPVLRLPVPPNPDPQPFTSGAIEALFTDLAADMEAARAPLLTISDADAVLLPIPLSSLWFDINLNGARDEGEGVVNVAARALTGRAAAMNPETTILFDTADAAWLAAYTHFVQAFSELVLAYEPAAEIDRVAEATAALDAVAADTHYQNGWDMLFGSQVDRAAMIYFALNKQPDPAHTRAAREHLIEMIAQNRVLWARVAAETDNTGEWVPNDNQDQAMGLPVPDGTGERWMAVLEDADKVLKGELLVPYWRLRSGAGLNVRRMFEDPRPIDLGAWLHGIGALPYAEAGPRMRMDSWRDFERLVRGDSLMFAVFLN